MSAKKAAKKAPKKVAAKETKNGSKEEVKKPDPIFNVLEGGLERSNAVGDAMKAVLERRKGRIVDFCPQSELVIETLPLRKDEHIELQWAINNSGLPRGFISVIGQDGLGKSTLVQNFLSSFMEQANAPCAIFVCENKPISPEWSVRAMSPNRAVASKMAEALMIFKMSQQDEMWEQFKEWVATLRDPSSPCYVPLSVPIILVVDPYGKLATKAEAAGGYVYDGMEKLTEVDIADRGHNWDRAKWSHEFVRRAGLLSNRNNLSIITVEHQNDQALGDGKKGGPSFLPDWHGKLNHRTKPGGQGLNQVAGLQLVLADCGNVYSCGEKVARRIIGRAYKNSYGTGERKFCFALKGDGFQDTDTYLDRGIRWDYTRIEWLVTQGLLGMRKTGNSKQTERYSSTDLGFTGLSLVDAAVAVQSLPLAVFDSLGAKLMIPGFVDIYKTIMDQVVKD